MTEPRPFTRGARDTGFIDHGEIEATIGPNYKIVDGKIVPAVRVDQQQEKQGIIRRIGQGISNFLQGKRS